MAAVPQRAKLVHSQIEAKRIVAGLSKSWPGQREGLKLLSAPTAIEAAKQLAALNRRTLHARMLPDSSLEILYKE